MKTEEIWEDVIDDLDKQHELDKKGKKMGEIEKNGAKRVKKSIGWTDYQKDVYTMKGSNIEVGLDDWEVYMGNGMYKSTDNEDNADMISLLAQINARLKRIERVLKENENRSERKTKT